MRRTLLLPAMLATMLCAAAPAQSPAEMLARMRGPSPDPAAMIARRSADIVLLLGLRPDQQAALEAMLRTTLPPSPPEPQSETPDASPRPFAAHLAEMERNAGMRAEAERARIAATRSFYQGLDGNQQKRFEALMRLTPGPMAGFGPPPGRPHPDGPDRGGPRPDQRPPAP